MTLIAIDPDVFTAAIGDEECERALEWVYENLDAIEIALDKKDVLRNEYQDFLVSEAEVKSIAVELMSYLWTYVLPQSRKISSHCSHNDEELINRRGCKTPVEPVLIGMATNAPDSGLTILLTPPSGLRKRCLHDAKIRTEFCKQIPKLTVRYASGTKIAFPALEEPPQKSERGHWFEDKAGHVIRELYDCPHLFLKTPQSIEKKVGDVDIWAYERAGNPRRVWVGECKLREFNEENWITYKEVKQLEVKLNAVRDYEKARTDVSSEPIEIKGFMVSNASNMTDEAWELANEIGATFIRTLLSDDWQHQGQWGIEKVEEFEPLFEASLWKGRSILTFDI